MASEYNKNTFLTNNNNNNSINNTFNSYAFRGLRTGSFRNRQSDRQAAATAIPVIQIKSSLNNRNGSGPFGEHIKLNTSSLLKSIAATSMAATTTLAKQPIIGSGEQKRSSNTNATPSLLGTNKSYYSSTRSFTSKMAKSADKCKLMAGQPKAITATNNNHQQQQHHHHHHHNSSINSNGNNHTNNNSNGKLKTQLSTSSGTSSIESIASKHNGFLNDSTKRIYSSVRVTKKEMPYLTAMTNGPNVTSNLNGCASNGSAKYRNSQNFPKTQSCYGGSSNNSSSRFSSSNSHSSSSYSTKFPNGLPFEDEFYQKRRQNSVSSTSKSELSDYGSIDNDNDSDQSLLPFEEEFARQQPSNEALYVDFSKPIGSAANSYSTSANNGFSSNNSNSSSSSNLNNISSHCTSRNYVCNPDDVIVQDQPVVYVAVKWWANEANRNADLNMRKPIKNDLV